MSIFGKFKEWVEVLAAPAEDPRQALAYTLQRHGQLMEKVRTARAKLASSKKELELKLSEARAKPMLSDPEGPLDPFAEQLRQMVAEELKALEANVKELEQEEQELAMIEQRLSLQEQAFSARQDALAAHYSAAETWTRIHEDLGGVSKELADLGLTVERAEQRSEEVREKTMAGEHLAGLSSLIGGQAFSSPAGRDLARLYSVEAASEAAGPLTQLLSSGFKNLMALEYEHRQLKDMLSRKQESDPLSLTYIRPLAEETYGQGLRVLKDGLALLRAIRSPGPEQLQQQIHEDEDEVRKLGHVFTEAAQATIGFKHEAIASAKERLEMLDRQHLRAGELLHQSSQCVSALNRTRIELAGLKIEGSRTSVEALTASLINVTNEARAVQEEMKSLGL